MKKLFNVRDFMFNAADVQKLGQYVADQIGLYDGLTLMNQDEIKDLTEEEPDDKRYSEALKNMDKYDMAVYCVDGSIKTGSEEDLAPIIVDGIEGRLRARDVWNLIDRLGLHPEDTGNPSFQSAMPSRKAAPLPARWKIRRATRRKAIPSSPPHRTAKATVNTIHSGPSTDWTPHRPMLNG